MHADIKGALTQLNKSWSAFEHKGKSMSKKEVKAILEYAVKKGYKTTSELKDDEVDKILSEMRTENKSHVLYSDNPITKLF